MKCVDLFASCGGLSLGFLNAGIEVASAIDNWDKSVNVYNDNFDHSCHLHDLTNEEGSLSIIEKYKPDMIAGGPLVRISLLLEKDTRLLAGRT